jgi:hypothetical protein
MASAMFRILRELERHKIHYFIEKTRPDSIRITATLAGERIEIEVFEDDHVEISRFFGDESIEGEEETLFTILRSM